MTVRLTVQRVERAEIATRALAILGLGHDAVDLDSIEGLCASLRRAASFLCPATPRQIVDAVHAAVSPLVEGLQRDAVADALNSLVMSGDLLELRQPTGQARLLFLGPPSFVEKHPGEYLLLGVRPHGRALFDQTAVDTEVFYGAHTRSVRLDSTSGIDALTAVGLHHLSREQWAKAPRTELPAQVVENVRRRLAADQAPGQVSDLTIVDTARPVHFYKGRWRELNEDDNGVFVGRRPQAYGAPVWCAVQVANGVPQAVLDLPVDSTVAPGWDEARRIQAAFDAENGHPQIYRVRHSVQHDSSSVLDFFCPLPSWAERYLTISGRPVPKGPGSLFSYGLPRAAVGEAQQFLKASLWMTAIKEDHRL